ncbi:MAG: metallophosphoesterase [Clostridia bacterium]|nr:metallophosphoesterase [Clostridia bacterium]
MKFVHIADMHFDAPFTSLNSKENLGEKRRLEQRNAFKKVIDFIEKNGVEYFFIAGDLYEQEYVKKSTIDFITKEFNRIPNTKIFITPGNHDPYLKNSYYATHDFGDNVMVFSSPKVEKYEDENVNVYGMAFNDFYMNSSELESVNVPFSNKLNILVAHCDLNGSKDEDGFSYNPALESKLNGLGFDYIALGHVHKNNIENKNKIYYPGSTISLGFDELGSHGMIAGDITKSGFSMEFVELDDRKFEEIEIAVDGLNSKEELAEKILDRYINDMTMYKIVLVGRRNFEIDTRLLLQMVSHDNILKIKDCTNLAIDLEHIALQDTLKGMFVREVCKMYEQGLCSEKEYQKAIEIGLEAM